MVTADFSNKASQDYVRLITNKYQFLVQVKANQKVILTKVTTESVAADVKEFDRCHFSSSKTARVVVIDY